MKIKVLSFNIHKGMGWHRFRPTLNEVAEHISELSPDLIFFQEILGDHVPFLMQEIWPYFCYGKNAVYMKGHFGNAILSKFPIIFYENLNLTTSRFDKRGLLHAIIQLPESHLHLLCVHLGLFKKGREIQYDKIVTYIESTIDSKEAIILGGDFNDWGSHATIPIIHQLKLDEAFMSLHNAYAKTFPAWRPLLKLDRIYSRGLRIQKVERMMQKSWRKISDHIAINVDFVIDDSYE